MKAFLAFMILMIGMVFTMPATSAVDPPGKQTFVIDQQHVAPAVMAQEEGGVAFEQQASGDQATIDDAGVIDFIKNNWFELLLGLFGFFEVIVRLTPTEKDNSILNWLINLLNAFNLKKGGGTFKVSPN